MILADPDRLPALPLAMWIQHELEKTPFVRLAEQLGISPRLLSCWRDELTSEGRPQFSVGRELVEDAFDRGDVGLWEVFPGVERGPRTEETHRWCPSCKESSAVDADRLCLWCGGPTEAERPKRGGWKRPDLVGSRYTEAQLHALHVFHLRDRLSIRELGRRTFAAAGYKSHRVAEIAISREWKRLGLQARDRIEATRLASTKHGMAPRYGSRAGYGTYRRRILHGEEDQPLCAGVRQNHPRKGEPCELRAMKGARFCSQHDPERAAARVAHLDEVHARQRARFAESALPMAPFAAFVARVHREAGSLRLAGERLGMTPTAVSVYRRSLGTDKKPKETIQRATVERVFEHAGVSFEEVYETEAIAA